MRAALEQIGRFVLRMAVFGLRLINALHCLLRKRKPNRLPGRIIVVKLDAIGDVILATPFLRELKRCFPAASITLVVNPITAPLVELCPYIDRLLTFDPTAHFQKPAEAGRLRAWLYALKLWRYRFDLAVLPRWDRDFYYGYYILCGCGARHIAAYARTISAARDTWLSRIEQRYATVLRIETPEHEVRRNLRLIEALGGTVTSDDLELWLSLEDQIRAAEWLKSLGEPVSGPIIAFGIGASHHSRCWPEESFVELGRILITQYGACVVLIGSGEEDQLRAEAIMRGGQDLRIFSAVGALSLRQSAALLTQCNLFVGNDSGPLHLAAAAHIPAVEICGLPAHAEENQPSSPVRFGPWGRFTRVVRPSCRTHAEQISPSDLGALNAPEVSVASVHAAVYDLIASILADRVTQYISNSPNIYSE